VQSLNSPFLTLNGKRQKQWVRISNYFLSINASALNYVFSLQLLTVVSLFKNKTIYRMSCEIRIRSHSRSLEMDDPTIRQPGFTLPWQQWSLLNRFRTGQGHVERHGILQTLICAPVVRPKRCPTLSNPALLPSHEAERWSVPASLCWWCCYCLADQLWVLIAYARSRTGNGTDECRGYKLLEFYTNSVSVLYGLWDITAYLCDMCFASILYVRSWSALVVSCHVLIWYDDDMTLQLFSLVLNAPLRGIP